MRVSLSVNARAQVSRGPAVRPVASSFRTVTPFMTSSQSVPLVREKTALVPAKTAVTEFAASVTTGRAAGAASFPAQVTELSMTWSRATTQPFGAQSESAFVANSKFTKTSLSLPAAASAAPTAGTSNAPDESGATEGTANSPFAIILPSARTAQRPANASASVKQKRLRRTNPVPHSPFPVPFSTRRFR